MTEPAAKVILDSISPSGIRLTTMEVTFHRFVLAEFNTHRVFSRNSASSRAIPVEKQLAKVKESPAWPLKWPSEQPGMQGGSDLTGEDLRDAQALFRVVFLATTYAVSDYIDRKKQVYGVEKVNGVEAWKYHALHKSLINRLLEPFMWHTVIVTATDWDGFWDQRCSPLAQPEIEAPAELMLEAYKDSSPTLVNYGEWHTPYIQPDEYDSLDLESRKYVSAARCARVSYLSHDGNRDPNKDNVLFNRLTTATPPHCSPLEHVATPSPDEQVRGNFRGWFQLRHEYWS